MKMRKKGPGLDKTGLPRSSQPSRCPGIMAGHRPGQGCTHHPSCWADHLLQHGLAIVVMIEWVRTDWKMACKKLNHHGHRQPELPELSVFFWSAAKFCSCFRSRVTVTPREQSDTEVTRIPTNVMGGGGARLPSTWSPPATQLSSGRGIPGYNSCITSAAARCVFLCEDLTPRPQRSGQSRSQEEAGMEDRWIDIKLVHCICYYYYWSTKRKVTTQTTDCKTDLIHQLWRRVILLRSN